MLLTISQAAEELSVAQVTVLRLVRDRAIPCRRIGGRILFTESDLAEYIETAKQPIRHAGPTAGAER
jgi:excisionase family DNA binding protein